MNIFLRQNNSLAALAFVAVAGFPSFSFAQTAPSYVLEEIVVSARKREETLQEAPVAITALQAEQIEAMGATNVADLTARLPNVQYNQVGFFPGEGVTSVRGLSAQARNAGFESGFGTFVDGAYGGRNGGSNRVLPDVERIEFLPGPQATLFGKNTTLGVMNIVTKKPDDVADGSLMIGAGDQGYQKLRASYRTPIAEGLGIGVTMDGEQGDGYITNIFDGSTGPEYESLAGIFQLSGNGESATFDLIIDYTDRQWENAYWLLNVQGGNPATGEVLPMDTTNVNHREFTSLRDNGFALNISLDVGPGTLASITSKRDYRAKNNFDDDYFPVSAQEMDFWDEEQKHISQELRYSGSADGISYVLGAYYQQQRIWQLWQVDLLQLTPDLNVLAQIDGDTVAAFANVDFDVTDTLGVEVGLRWDNEEKLMPYYKQSGGGVLGVLDIDTSDSLRVSNLSYTAALRYAINQDYNSYLRYSLAHKSGGFNIDFNTNPVETSTRFGDESVNSYELGLKGQITDALSVNLAVFYSLYHDLQVNQLFFPPGATLPILTINNAGKVRAQGLELQTTYSIDRLLLNLSVGLTDAKVVDYPDPTIADPARNHKGNKLGEPEITGSLFAMYKLPIGSMSVDLIGEWLYQDKYGAGMTASPEARNISQGETIGILNFRSRFNITDRISLTAWVKNIADERPITSRSPISASGVLPIAYGLAPGSFDNVLQGRRLEPRVWGMDLRYTF